MFKKLSSILLSLILLALCAVPAFAALIPANEPDEPEEAAETSAAASVSVVSAYLLDNNMYCFVNPKDEETDLSEYTASVLLNGAMYRQAPEQIEKRDEVVSYMLLIDASTSMQAYTWQMNSFATSLLQKEEKTTKISIATFGEKFEVAAENISDSNILRSALGKISFAHQTSDISGGVTDAIRYLSSHEREPGELVNLVVMTDGEAYIEGVGYTGDGIAEAAETAKEAIASSPEVVVHAIGFKSWEPNTHDAISSGSGLDLRVVTGDGASRAASLISGFSDGATMLEFPVSDRLYDRRLTAQLSLSHQDSEMPEFIPISNVKNFDITGFATEETEPETSKPAETEPGGTNPGDTEPGDEAPGETPPAETLPEAPASESGKPSKADGELPDDAETPEDGETAEDEETATGRFGILKWIIIAVVVVVVVVAAILIGVGIGSNRSKKAVPMAQAPVPAAMPRGPMIGFEMLSGNPNAGRAYALTDELIIGSDSSCGAVLADASVTARNTRIFLMNGMVYIEDLNSVSNTAIGGMKIFAPNQLRDGDEVTIGRVRFRVRFININPV